MRVAVCSNEYGTRLQLERLLKREADKKIAEGITFYADTFGSPGSLVIAPMEYDLYIINYQDDEWTKEGILQRLKDRGVKAPIHFCEGEMTRAKLEGLVEESYQIWASKKQVMLDKAKPAAWHEKIRIKFRK